MPTPPQPPQPPTARPAAPAEPPRPGGPARGPGPGSPPQAEGEPGCACPPGGGRPLPDPAAVRLCRVPDSAPPYDGTDCYPAADAAADSRAADTRAADTRAADTRAADTGPHGPGPHGPGPHGPGPHGAGPHRAAPRREAASGSQPPPGWPSQFAQVLAETLAGSRPPRQLVPWTTEQARTHIRRLGAQLSAAERPRIRRVITSRPASDVVEMAVIVGFGPRVRALAVRLEQAGPTAAPGRPARPPRWVCTAVEAA